MKLIKLLFVAIGFSSMGSFAQDLVIEELPIATINESFYVTIPEIPLQEDYFIDISHMDFVDEADAIKKFGVFVTGNLVTPTVNFDEKYVILHIHTEYMGGDLDIAKMQVYLDQLTKPTY